MTLKTFTAACAIISAALVALPQNIIGCGGSIDPYDYYLSFFNQYAASQIKYKPFFYTNEQFLFDYEEPVSSEDELVKEWVQFAGNAVAASEVRQLVMKFPARDIHTLYYHIEQQRPARLPDSIGRNQFAQYFIKNKNLEALGYILYAKKVEPFATIPDEWSPDTRDSVKMDGLLKNGLQLYQAAKSDLFKLKYGYQVVRLAHYNDHYSQAVELYDELIANNREASILQPMSLALKAGALFRLGQNAEAAYLFSKAFHQGRAKRISNYYGFNWSVVREDKRQKYLALCQNNREKAGMLSLFALSNPTNDMNVLKEIYALDPSSDLLPTLVVREINKYEENYLTPLVEKENQRGLLSIDYYYYRYRGAEKDSVLASEKTGLADFIQFVNQVGTEAKVANPALMVMAAAHGAYMLKDFEGAKAYLAKIKTLHPDQRVQDQWMLTNLLTTISAKETIDAPFEAGILPSLDWLYQKADAAVKQDNNEGYYQSDEQQQWYKFYRNLMVDVLAARYKAQGDLNKAALAIGAPEALMPGYNAVTFLRSQFNGQQAADFYGFVQARKFTPYEKFLVGHNSIKLQDIADFTGTAYLRDYDYDNAIKWLQRAPGKHPVIEKDPFKDLLFDREERLPNDEVTTTKLAYAKEMKKLHSLVQTDPAHAATYYYKLALGCYNITHYGYAWNLVAYWRSGVDGYFMPKNATAFQREYYGAFTAENYFKKAMEASNDKEFKARCLFMMAKCSQKQIAKPQYIDFGYDDYDRYEQATDAYYKKFFANKYYPQLKNGYGDTRFYKDAATRCSYLRDFAGR
ncbi:hypothetical protein ABDK00_018115 [Niabella insulamsoli]|uniref:hypothetical protein n=1 Tax=Niabella insulamsoli TaxID=3144874 RepID=UPI0031FE3255